MLSTAGLSSKPPVALPSLLGGSGALAIMLAIVPALGSTRHHTRYTVGSSGVPRATPRGHGLASLTPPSMFPSERLSADLGGREGACIGEEPGTMHSPTL